VKSRLRYWFDNLMSRGTGVVIAALAVVTLLLVVLVAVAIVALGAAGQDSFGRLLWLALLRLLGTSENVLGASRPALFLLAMLAGTLGSMLVTSALIGLLSNGIRQRLADLQRGRSPVLERGHVVVLGWSDTVHTVVQQLVVAGANRARSVIVVLGDKDKVEMDTLFRERLGRTGRTHIVTRSGNPMDVRDVALVNPTQASAVVVCAPEDTSVIKTVLAVTNCGQEALGRMNIVAAIRDPRNLDVARIAGKGHARFVLSEELTGRIIAQTCRCPGLSSVYADLLDFEGDEIYFKPEPDLAGKTFGDVLGLYEDSSVIGIADRDGTRLNPPMDTVLPTECSIIAISRDYDTVVRNARSTAVKAIDIPNPRTSRERVPEHTLVLGWNEQAPFVVSEIGRYVARGSTLTLVSEESATGERLVAECGEMCSQQMTVRRADTTDRGVLDELMTKDYDHVVVLSERTRSSDEQVADARTLMTLLHLRDIKEKTGKRFSIVSEMLDVRNKDLADVVRANDFIVSDQFVSLLMSMLATEPRLAEVFEDLFGTTGSELYLRAAGDLVRTGISVPFATVVETARGRGEIALGYIIAAERAVSSGLLGVHLNPPKSHGVTFAENDSIIVLAETG
jgi:Trk K+ transport system NAD-binding subunit